MFFRSSKSIRVRFPDALLSVDTYKPRVAKEALDRGVHLVNDVTGLRFSSESATHAARVGAAVCVMHALGRPGDMPHEHSYADVVGEVAESLVKSVQTAKAAGVGSILVDPGFGFGKTTAENLRLVAHTDRIAQVTGCPVLIGASRKSSIGQVLRRGDPPPASERLFGSVGVAVAAVRWGAQSCAFTTCGRRLRRCAPSPPSKGSARANRVGILRLSLSARP